jgi:hypothetical protein
MKGFRNRAAQKARKAATGGDGPPAGQDSPAPGAPPAATTADRGAMRKRLRRAQQIRDDLVHDLGALVMEMHRQGRHDPALVERKAREAVTADAEVRALGGALDRGEPLAGGVTTPCRSCGALVAGTDSFCSRCGTAVTPGAAAQPAPPAPSARVEAPPPSSGDRVEAPPPSSGDRVAAPPPSAGDRVDGAPSVDAPPPSPADRAQAPPDDGVPTFTVNAP